MSGERRRCLNIGAGKVIKPTTDEEEWVNTDILPLPGIDLRFNAFVYPFPIPSGSFDHIHCSHVAEHVPHQSVTHHALNWDDPWGTNALIEWTRRLGDLDGFFAFFAECWRVLRPGGTIYVEVPHAGADGADQDPTHQRRILPSTIGYLCSHESPTFEYLLPFAFTCQGAKYGIDDAFSGLPLEEIGRLAKHQRNVIHTISFVLERQERSAAVD